MGSPLPPRLHCRASGDAPEAGSSYEAPRSFRRWLGGTLGAIRDGRPRHSAVSPSDFQRAPRARSDGCGRGDPDQRAPAHLGARAANLHHGRGAAAVGDDHGRPARRLVSSAAEGPDRSTSFRGLIERPIFIVSTPRSGSTLLFETLEQAPGLYTTGQESHWAIEDIPGLSPPERGWSSNRLTAEDATS